MVNIKHEQTLVKRFVNVSAKTDIDIKHYEINSLSKHMDCEFVYDGEYIRVEAKQFFDTRNSSQNFIKIFGGIIKGRSLSLASDSTLPVVYGVLIDEGEFDKFQIYKQTISTNDWNRFGDIFEVKYIFVVGANEINYYEWDSI